MNRRRFSIGLSLFGGALGTGVVLAKPAPEVTPVVAPKLGATPDVENEDYDGPIGDLWDRPWRTEGKRVIVKGVILNKLVASKGEGFQVGADDIPYRSLIVLSVPDAPGRGLVVVATNDDLRSLSKIHTAQITGVYAGEQNVDENGGYWSVPLLVALSIEAVPTEVYRLDHSGPFD